MASSDYEAAVSRGSATEISFEPDMGLFPAAADRAFRFLCSDAINRAVQTTDHQTGPLAPVHIVTLEAGFPWLAAMQVNEQRKRCDSIGRAVTANVLTAANYGAGLQAARINDSEASSIKQSLTKEVGQYVRTTATNVLLDPPPEVVAAGKDRTRHKLLVEHLKQALNEADFLWTRLNEPAAEEYRGKGGWELLHRQPVDQLGPKLAKQLGDAQKAQKAIDLLAHLTAHALPTRLRPFELTILDSRSRDELIAQAEVIYEAHPDVKQTNFYQEVLALLDNYTQHEEPFNLDPLDDDSTTVAIVCHWPLRHQATGQADQAGWAWLLDGLQRKLQTNGIGVFFPWNLPKSFDPGHLDITLGGVQASMVNDFPFEVTIASEPTESILAAVADIGLEPAALAPQLRNGGRIGRLIVRKRKTLSRLLDN